MDGMTQQTIAAPQPIAAALSRAAERLFLARQAEHWLGALGRLESLRGELRARVVDVIHETPDARTFVLRPGRRWPGHRAGQWATVEVEIDGARVRRCYSISSAPGDALISFTVKRVPGGRVSGWLHERVRVGDVLTLGAPGGEFTLPLDPADGALPERLLFVSGGSGITPTASMLRALEARAADAAKNGGGAPMPDVVLVHHARRREDVIFRDAIEALAGASPWLRLVWCLDDAPGGTGGFDEARLAALVPDLAERETFLCGPPPMMARVEAMWRARGLEERLRQERFVAPGASPVGAAPDSPGPDGSASARVSLHLVRSQRSVEARTEGTLLDQLERAGERPASGCRMGICRSCTCVKRSGTVRHALTGAISSAPDEPIQLCVSVPCTDVELGL
jgi:stearoyl-CoA 9-desaturase NADPH oxidoreductase